MLRADLVRLYMWICCVWKGSLAFIPVPESFRRSADFRHGVLSGRRLLKVQRRQVGSSENPSSFNDDNDESSSIELLMQLAMSHVVSRALFTVVQLRIPDMFARQEDALMAMDDIISHIKAECDVKKPNKRALLQLMRVLASVGIFHEEESAAEGNNSSYPSEKQVAFRLTAAGRLLRQDEKQSNGAASMILHLLEKPLWDAWAHVPAFVAGKDSVKDSLQLPFDAANSMSAADYYSTHPDSLQHANTFVKWMSEQEIEACVQGFDWGALNGKTVVDLGGHRGLVMQAVARQYPNVRCVCLDLPQVIDELVIESANKTSVRFVSGDMFDPSTIPACDVIFMKHIVLCDWGEEDSRRILQTCHAALPEDGLVIIGEAILENIQNPDKDARSQLPFLADALMLVVGREGARTISEWDEFARSGGFRVNTVTPTVVPSCFVIVLKKIANNQ